MTGADEVARIVERRRALLAAEFGWTHVAVRGEWDAAARALRLSGCVAVPRVGAALRADLAPLLPAGWRVDGGGVTALVGRGWRALPPGVTRLWRTPGVADGTGAYGHGPRDSELTSELLASDGPVELLHALPGAALVRGVDGAVGWVRGRLGPAAARPLEVAWERRPFAAGEALRRLAASLRSYRGVAYRLGGTTRRHVDCSGLVQRCVREALGRVLPRHSSEQAPVGVSGRALGEPGDLVFMAGVGAADGHVGVVLRGARPGQRTLVHASTSRGRVVEEPLDRCLRRATGGVRHVELAQVIEGRVF
ncbi:MAG: C40 family peptidase [Myxococcales bacterium]|nr:C40 family peptidase [Myxococcales bacterium]